MVMLQNLPVIRLTRGGTRKASLVLTNPHYQARWECVEITPK